MSASNNRISWIKSTYSDSYANCVEVAAAPPGEPRAKFVKSSYSATGGDCVEVAPNHPAILVRDSKDHRHPQLAFPTPHWVGFTRRLAGR
ncbi:DUF397 domain-containing protein [Yinghuangia sp. YIM S10712]|uniref:DUF397 domain-containing protein n=1 Tax=Yinghuangia sp. YIM S10712 TaxID=3436930 RepID=UPI003F52995B